jgi:hypothetical protein
MWGNRDAKTANTGTIQIYANGYCVGTSTLFQTEAKVGEYIIADSKKYLIVRIDSNTAAQVQASNLGAAVATVGASNTYIFQQAPAYVAATEVNGNALEVYGIDTTEVGVANGSLISIAVNFPGSGYTANAAVTVGGNGTANAQANSTGRIAAVNVVLSGNSYTTPPAVTIAAPAKQSFNANSAVATNGFISIATNVLQANDLVTYEVAAGNTVIAGLTNGASYYVVTPNSTGVYLSSTIGGSAITLTKGLTETGHTLQGQTATARAPVISGLSGKVAHAGWVRRVVGTGNRSGRIQYETLVAMGSIAGDAEDVIAKDS